MAFYSPLRYPGGKRKLVNFIKLIFRSNNLLDGEYVEPYAGGASVALSLLYDEYVRHVHINDLDRAVYAFWHSVMNNTEAFCQLISNTPVTMEEWHRQKKLQATPDLPLLELGFSTFFLNRTNRSGIISGGVIGGKNQTGKWLLDARYNKDELICRIRKVARYQNRISLYNLDACEFMKRFQSSLPARTLIYLDPPYFVKGQQALYTNFYEPSDHENIAHLLSTISHHWIVSYDDVPEIRAIYKNYKNLSYSLHYSAQTRYKGAEIMFFRDNVEVPEVSDPAKVKNYLIQPRLL